MGKTEVFITKAEAEEIRRLLSPAMRMNFATGVTIINKPGRAAAQARLDEFAVDKGLPKLPEPKHYGLSAEFEILSPDPKEKAEGE